MNQLSNVKYLSLLHDMIALFHNCYSLLTYISSITFQLTHFEHKNSTHFLILIINFHKSSLSFQFLWKSINHSTISLHSIDTIIHIIYQPLHSFSSIFHQLIHILQLHFSINTLYINHSQTYSNLIILFSLQSFQPSLVTSYLHSNYSTHN